MTNFVSLRVGSIVAGMLCVIGLVGSGPVIAADAPSTPVNTSASRTATTPSFATVWRLRGDVQAKRGDKGKARTLQIGDAVFVGEQITADPASEAVLKTDDAGLIAMRPGSVFMAERFVANGQPTDSATFRVFAGGLRMITGWIGHINRPGYRVVTPTATIGIRGTDHEPYVVTAQLADALLEAPGTYDKVNRGGTTVDNDGNTLDVDAGKVGFVRMPHQSTGRTRALITLLLPTLLNRVPAFYVPGQFDAELDALSEQTDADADNQLQERRNAPKQPAGKSEKGGSMSTPDASTQSATGKDALLEAAPAQPKPIRVGQCSAKKVAATWLAQLDEATAQRNASVIGDMFAQDIRVRVSVRQKDGSLAHLEVGRDEFVQSTITALAALSEYKQRRPVVEGWPAKVVGCEHIAVKSIVIEQGKQNSLPYRLESLENFVLERREDKWVATEASTQQR